MKKNILLSALIIFYACTPIHTYNSWNNDDTSNFDKKLAIACSIAYLTFVSIYCYLIYQQNKTHNELWTVSQPGDIAENFDSVAGAHEAKDALLEIVEYLKNPKQAKRLGAKVPTGVLLTGEPGTGKTLLARAVAGEANCSFISVSGSVFEQVYVGLGAARVRALFEQIEAEKKPCIVFIDEIDAVGGKRSQEYSWINQTINQLLTCMDGFNSKNRSFPIIIIGATNHECLLDPALLRPGRFDRIVHVARPCVNDRIDLLNIYLQNIIFADDLNLEIIAKQTPGFTGADIAQLVNQATLLATKNHQDCVTMQNFHDAINLITLGAPDTSIKMDDREKKITAYHEAGHTLLHLLQPETTSEFYSVTIVPRSKALGITLSFRNENKYSSNKEEHLAEISTLLAGRAAEELMFGEIGTGIHNDFTEASSIAFHMVCSYGMSELGTRIYNVNHISDATRTLIDNEVNKILDQQYQKVMKLLKEHKAKLIKLAERLLEKNTLYADEVYELLQISKPNQAIA